LRHSVCIHVYVDMSFSVDFGFIILGCCRLIVTLSVCLAFFPFFCFSCQSRLKLLLFFHTLNISQISACMTIALYFIFVFEFWPLWPRQMYDNPLLFFVDCHRRRLVCDMFVFSFYIFYFVSVFIFCVFFSFCSIFFLQNYNRPV